MTLALGAYFGKTNLGVRSLFERRRRPQATARPACDPRERTSPTPPHTPTDRPNHRHDDLLP